MAYRKALEVVQAVDRDYPGLIVTNGKQFRDQVCHRLRREDPNWGIKARNPDGTNENVDALAYLHGGDRSRKDLIDIIISSETPNASPAWQEFLGDNVGNGYWTEPKLPDLDGATPPPPPPSGDPCATAAQVAALAALAGKTADLVKQADDMNELRYRDLIAHFDELKKLIAAKPEHFGGSVRVFGVSAPITLDPR